MKWILRSAFAAASLGSAVPAFAQYDPPPMMPPVRPLPDDEPAVAPAEPPTHGIASVLSKAPPSDWVPAASGPKPPPAERVQWAVPGRPDDVRAAGGAVATPALPPLSSLAPLSPLAPTSPNEPPTARPDFLPPLVPGPPVRPPASQSAQLPAPPSRGPLPAIPVAPPIVPGAQPAPKPVPPAVARPEKPGALPAFPDTASSGKAASKGPNTGPAAAGDDRTARKPARTSDSPPALPPDLARRSPLAPPGAAPAPADPAGAGPPCACATDCCPTARVSSLCEPVRLFPQDGPVRVRGWVDGGYVYNTSNPASKFNGPYNSVDRTQEPMLNQLYAIVDRPLPAGGAWGAGFRADVLYGLDHYLGQSRGFEVDRDSNQRWNGQYYGLALPQVYGELGNDVISLKLGHFYSLVGYEALPSVANFFYSHAYSYQFGQPITHWGGVVTTQFTRNMQAQVGLVNGWDALVGRTNNVNLTGRLLYTPDSRWWWASAAFVTGDEQTNPAGLPGVVNGVGNRTRYDVLFGLTPGGPCGRWEYVFHHYYGWQENGTPAGNYARWYGIDQYVYYRISRTLRWGTRFEWFRDEDGTRVGLNRPANPNKPPLPGNYFSLTNGVNYTPIPNFIVRPEVRWDFATDATRPAFDDGKKSYQLLLGCDLIWLF